MLLNYCLKLTRLILIYYCLLCRCQESAVPLVCWGNGQFLLGQQQVLQYSQLRRSSQVFLAMRLHVWYAKYRQERASPAREEDEDPLHWEIGLVVSAGNTPSSVAEGPAFSLEEDDETAASAAAAPAAAQPAAAAAAPAHPPRPPCGG